MPGSWKYLDLESFKLIIDFFPSHNLFYVATPSISTAMILLHWFIPSHLGNCNCILTCFYLSAPAVQTEELFFSGVLVMQLYAPARVTTKWVSNSILSAVFHRLTLHFATVSLLLLQSNAWKDEFRKMKSWSDQSFQRNLSTAVGSVPSGQALSGGSCSLHVS